MTTWRCCIPGEPVGHGRPRFARHGNFVHAYTPPRTARWQADAVAAMQATWTVPPLLDPVAVIITAVMQRPKRLMRRKDPSCRLLCQSKPDVDNVAKAVLDSLTKAGVLRDDAQVCSLTVSKLYTAVDESPRVEVIVETRGE